jgi:hypothetical protein
MNAKAKAKELITKFDAAVHPGIHALMCVDEQIKLVLEFLDGKEQAMVLDFLCDVKEEIVNYEYRINERN